MTREGDPHRFDPIVYRTDYDHLILVRGRAKYPEGRCTRPDCWPCVIRALNEGKEQTWEGLARSAAARSEAGVGLTVLDNEALQRFPNPSHLVEDPPGSGIAFYR